MIRILDLPYFRYYRSVKVLLSFPPPLGMSPVIALVPEITSNTRPINTFYNMGKYYLLA